MLFSTNADLVYTLFMGLLLINIFIIAIGYAEIKGIQRLLHVPKGIIFPIMLVFAVVGSFVVANSFVDVLIMLAIWCSRHHFKRKRLQCAYYDLRHRLGRYFGIEFCTADFIQFPFCGLFHPSNRPLLYVALACFSRFPIGTQTAKESIALS